MRMSFVRTHRWSISRAPTRPSSSTHSFFDRRARVSLLDMTSSSHMDGDRVLTVYSRCCCCV